MTAACARRRDHSRKSSLSIAIDKWLRRLVENRDDAALIVAMTVGSLLIEDGPHAWFKLSRIVALTGQPHAIVEGILYRLRGHRWLIFKRRCNGLDATDPEFRFTIPNKMPVLIERTRAWPISEVQKR